MRDEDKSVILVVDDESMVTDIVSRWLSAEGYICLTAHDGEDALDVLSEHECQLVVSDINMPVMDGLHLLENARELCPDTAFIMLTGLDDRETAMKAIELGAYGYMIKPFEGSEVVINVKNALRRRQLELMRDNYEAGLEQRVEARTAEVQRVQEEITVRLTTASEFRDAETGEHVRRIGLFSELLGQHLGWPRSQTRLLRLAAPMHDVGKIGIPDSILQKPGKLNGEEWATMQTHTSIGARMLEGSGIELLGLSAEIALRHHENWDGSGYPGGQAGDEIPQAARIVKVLDVYDALIHERVYKPPMEERKALELIEDGRESEFDPVVLDAFMECLPAMRLIRTDVGG